MLVDQSAVKNIVNLKITILNLTPIRMCEKLS